jgi:hypothetical protein
MSSFLWKYIKNIYMFKKCSQNIDILNLEISTLNLEISTSNLEILTLLNLFISIFKI